MAWLYHCILPCNPCPAIFNYMNGGVLNMMYMEESLFNFLRNESKGTVWHKWMIELVNTMKTTSVKDSATWKGLELLAENIPAVIWLVEQLERMPSCMKTMPDRDSLFYILVCYCRSNRALGFVTDRFRYHYMRHDRENVVSCIRILSYINEKRGYSHLNFLYNFMMACVRKEFRNFLDSGVGGKGCFLTDKDFRQIQRLLPDFACSGFRELVQMNAKHDMTASRLAECCHMSQTTFRERFKKEFGVNVSFWLRDRKKERILSMLRDPGISLVRIAESNGFRSASTFTDYCKRNFGFPPTKLREKILSE